MFNYAQTQSQTVKALYSLSDMMAAVGGFLTIMAGFLILVSMFHKKQYFREVHNYIKDKGLYKKFGTSEEGK